jgi:hypothetical protein
MTRQSDHSLCLSSMSLLIDEHRGSRHGTELVELTCNGFGSSLGWLDSNIYHVLLLREVLSQILIT